MFTKEDFKLGSTKTNGLRYLTFHGITFRIIKTIDGFWRGSVMDKVFKSGSAVYFDLEGNAVFKSFLKFINDAEKSEAIRKRIFSNIFS